MTRIKKITEVTFTRCVVDVDEGSDFSVTAAYHKACQEPNTLVPSRQKDINEDNRKFQQYDVSYPVPYDVYRDIPPDYIQGEFVLLPPDQKQGSNDDSKLYVQLPYQGNIKDSKQYATVLFPTHTRCVVYH